MSRTTQAEHIDARPPSLFATLADIFGVDVEHPTHGRIELDAPTEQLERMGLA